MAVSNLSSGERQELYRDLFLINRSFNFIVRRISALENARKLNAQHFEELRGLTQEVQPHINNRLLEEIHTVERTDWHGFGRIRRSMEERYKRPNPDKK